MKCERIQELLITDYSDGCLSSGIVAQIENHISKCQKCRDYADAVRQASIAPFDNAKLEEVPPYLWNKIKYDIENRQDVSGIGERAYAFFHEHVFRSALAMGVVTSVVVISLFVLRPSVDNADNINIYMNEQLQVLSSLNNGDGDTVDEFGTGIEEYFL